MEEYLLLIFMLVCFGEVFKKYIKPIYSSILKSLDKPCKLFYDS